MRRQHPLFSPTGIIMSAILFLGLALVLWRTGGQIFNPGPLTAQAKSGVLLGEVASHAEITACSTCHQPLQTRQGELCMDCHNNIRDQITNRDGIHARMGPVGRCFDCHPDHRGRDFDPTRAGLVNFNHNTTGFFLIWHQVNYDASPMDCAACHVSDDFTVEAISCEQCHADHDLEFMSQHELAFGKDCLACHDGVDRMAEFDHELTNFPLEGEHSNITCADCHVDGQFEELPLDCAACHAEPALHLGVFQPDCEACHSTQGWVPAILNGNVFDHNSQTGFSLQRHEQDYSGGIINCTSCHQSDLRKFDESTCITCHEQEAPAFMADHLEQFGSACVDCHDGVDRMSGFDHQAVFPLDGQHAEIECTACHVDHLFTGTPTECSQCHAEPEIHAGIFGLGCDNCHTTTAWSPASLKSHTFPLDHGGEGVIDCLTCHPTTYVDYTCDACHEPAEMLNKHNEEGIFDIAGRCVECHPTGREKEGNSGDND